ncbi:SAF domain-containing protein [Streptomyces sp. NPDC020801]|uniref:SAF domain-containing protein n=1 Tax=Streptomyces sp. NPDC020801 TaxID=3365093 RepID=UPI00378C9195
MSKTEAPAGMPGQLPAQAAHSQVPSAAVGFRARRRRPGMYALAVALIAAGGGGGFLAFQATGERTPVLAVAHDVQVGDVIQDADLVEASVSLDSALKPIPASQRSEVVGKRAAVALVPGALLSQGEVTTHTLVKAGERLVGIGLKSTQMPATRLSPGDKVLVVFTPSDGSATSTATGKAAGDSASPKTISARVVRVGDKQQTTNDQVVDVAVPAEEGPSLAAQAATGNVALVVDASGGS